jgi:hypothetical protein
MPAGERLVVPGMTATPSSTTTPAAARIGEVDGRALLDVSLLRSKAADL